MNVTESLTTILLNIFITCVSSGGIMIAYLEHKWKKDERKDLEHEVLKYLTRESLTRYLRDLLAEGEASDAEKRYAEEYHSLYKKLGWNGQLDNLLNSVMQLPVDKGGYNESKR